MAKQYDVCVPRIYRDKSNEPRTHFWKVGTAFSLANRDGISVKLYSKMIVTDQFVLFARDPRAAADDEPPPDAEPWEDG